MKWECSIGAGRTRKKEVVLIWLTAFFFCFLAEVTIADCLSLACSEYCSVADWAFSVVLLFNCSLCFSLFHENVSGHTGSCFLIYYSLKGLHLKCLMKALKQVVVFLNGHTVSCFFIHWLEGASPQEASVCLPLACSEYYSVADCAFSVVLLFNCSLCFAPHSLQLKGALPLKYLMKALLATLSLVFSFTAA